MWTLKTQKSTPPPRHDPSPSSSSQRNPLTLPNRKTPLSALIPSHENIYTLPNILTFSRLIAAPIVGYLIIHDLHIPALGLFIYAGVTDLVDGWIARRWCLQTVLGTVIDPMADKALMTVVTICLAVKEVLPGKSTMPVSSSPPYNLCNRPTNTNASPPSSPPSNYHPWPRRSPRPVSLLLPLHLSPTPPHLRTILGLLSPER